MKTSTPFDYKFLLIILPFIFIIINGCDFDIIQPEVKNGKLDLSQIDFENDEIVELTGNWKFHWKKFTDPQNFKNQEVVNKDTFVNVPGLWMNYESANAGYPKIGWASYKLSIKVNQSNTRLLLFSKKALNTASRIYVNGELVGQSGEIGSSDETSIPSDHIEFIPFKCDTNYLNIVVHTSNFTKQFSGGINNKLFLGKASTINTMHKRHMISKSVVFGSVLIIMLLQFFLYMWWSKDKSILYFGLTCLFVLFYFSIDITKELGISSFYVNHAFVNVGWILAISFLLLHVIELFKLSPIRLIGYSMLAASFITIIIYFIGLGINYFRYIAVAVIIFISVIAIKATVDKLIHAKIFLIGILILGITAISDLLSDENILRMPQLVYYGVVFFLFMQVYSFSLQFAKTFNKNKKLSEELAVINENLEDTIKKRTQEIQNKNRQLNQLVATKERFFSIIAHDLKSPLSSMISLFSLFKLKKEEFDKEKTNKMLEIIQDSADRTYSLLENLLSWARSQRNEINVNPEKVSIEELVKLNLDLYSIQITNKQINVETDIALGSYCNADYSMINLVIRNLLNNSVKFTKPGGEIIIESKESGEDLLLSIQDNGIGIKPENIKRLFDIAEEKIAQGTEGEKGTGLGLLICKEFIEKNKGKISVESNYGKGSKFTIVLPKYIQ